MNIAILNILLILKFHFLVYFIRVSFQGYRMNTPEKKLLFAYFCYENGTHNAGGFIPGKSRSIKTTTE